MKDYTDEFSFVLKPSLIEGGGVGVFATHDIKKGTKLALNKEGGDSRVIDAKKIPKNFRSLCISLPNGKVEAPKEFNHLWIVWYLNHSKKPNVYNKMPEDNYYALKDIKKDEEILVDYNAFNEPKKAKESYYKK